MVQTEAQYIFLHDAILEGALSGKTEMPVEHLSRYMKKLEVLDKEDESGYKKEFQVSLWMLKLIIRSYVSKHTGRIGW